MNERTTEAPPALIDRWFPVSVVDEACGTPAGSGQNEKGIFTWFASRPIAQARAAVICSLLREPNEDPDETTVRLVEKALRTGAEDALEEIAALVPDVDGKRPVVLDCFSGRGIIPLEAARIGVRAVGIDLSPVAVLASRLLADWPLRDWTNEPDLPFSMDDTTEDEDAAAPTLLGLTSDEPKLIADLRRFFAEVDRRVEDAVREHYPRTSDGSFPWGYLWATTIPCDTCRRRFPLVGSLTLRHAYAATDDPGQSFEIVTDTVSGDWRVDVHDGPPVGRPTMVAPTGKRGKAARCPFCDHSHPLETVKAKGFADEYADVPLVAADLTAVSVADRRGRVRTIERKVFRVLRDDETKAAMAADPSALRSFGEMPAAPTERVAPGNASTVDATGYGYKTFASLMNSRQVLLFAATAHAIRSTAADARMAGITQDYSTALAGYAVSIMVRRLRRATRGARLEAYGDRPAVGVGDVFTNESGVSFGFDWFETGPGGGPGTWRSLSKSALRPLATHLRGLTRLATPGVFRQGTATSLPYRDATVDAVVTDPPYYNMINYADVSDVFYVWLRRALFDIMPDLFSTPGDALGLQDKSDEIVVKQGKAPEDHRTTDWYEQQMSAAFRGNWPGPEARWDAHGSFRSLGPRSMEATPRCAPGCRLCGHFGVAGADRVRIDRSGVDQSDSHHRLQSCSRGPAGIYRRPGGTRDCRAHPEPGEAMG